MILYTLHRRRSATSKPISAVNLCQCCTCIFITVLLQLQSLNAWVVSKAYSHGQPTSLRTTTQQLSILSCLFIGTVYSLTCHLGSYHIHTSQCVLFLMHRALHTALFFATIYSATLASTLCSKHMCCVIFCISSTLRMILYVYTATAQTMCHLVAFALQVNLCPCCTNIFITTLVYFPQGTSLWAAFLACIHPSNFMLSYIFIRNVYRIICHIMLFLYFQRSVMLQLCYC